MKYCTPALAPDCHEHTQSLSWTYPESVGEHFHCTLQGKQPSEGCVTVVKDKLISVCLMVILTQQINQYSKLLSCEL